eukprot:COSAG01_NODE_1419_length_10368_cov_131.656344_1_plen_593_part_10
MVGGKELVRERQLVRPRPSMPALATTPGGGRGRGGPPNPEQERTELAAAAREGGAAARTPSSVTRWSPLHRACRLGSDELVAALLGAKADPSARNRYGDTPLHVATQHGHLPAMRRLLSSPGVDPNARSSGRRRWTALHCAASQSSHACAAALLLRADADPTLSGLHGVTAVALGRTSKNAALLAWVAGDTDSVRRMAHSGVDTNADPRHAIAIDTQAPPRAVSVREYGEAAMSAFPASVTQPPRDVLAKAQVPPLDTRTPGASKGGGGGAGFWSEPVAAPPLALVRPPTTPSHDAAAAALPAAAEPEVEQPSLSSGPGPLQLDFRAATPLLHVAASGGGGGGMMRDEPYWREVKLLEEAIQRASPGRGAGGGRPTGEEPSYTTSKVAPKPARRGSPPPQQPPPPPPPQQQRSSPSSSPNQATSSMMPQPQPLPASPSRLAQEPEQAAAAAEHDRGHTTAPAAAAAAAAVPATDDSMAARRARWKSSRQASADQAHDDVQANDDLDAGAASSVLPTSAETESQANAAPATMVKAAPKPGQAKANAPQRMRRASMVNVSSPQQSSQPESMTAVTETELQANAAPATMVKAAPKP